MRRNPETFSGRLGVQQRVLPVYRAPFFEMLAQACMGGLGLFAGLPRPEEAIPPGELQIGRAFQARNLHLLGGPLYFCYQRGLNRWLQDWNPDALILEANPRYLASPSAVKWMHARGRKVIGWGLGAPPFSGPLAGFRQAQRIRFLREFDAWVAYSRRGAAEYAALGLPPEKIFVALNAVAARPGGPPPARPARKERLSLLFVGRLQARKRVDSLLRACAELEDPKPELVIVGEGPEREPLRALAGQIYPAAQFIGARHGEELRPYFAAADLFVLPGTGGLAVQEAMAHGLPVIVARGDGTQDDLVRPGNGWQIPPEDYQALVRTLRMGVSDLKRLREMGKESFRIVSEEINLERMVEAFVKALNSLE
jgi:glycosyltransferase involved in cell wall biosynthesis